MIKANDVDKVCAVLKENAAQVDSEGSWPQSSVRAISDAGMLTPGSVREFADTIRRFAQACPSTAMIYVMHVCGAQVIAAGPNKKLAEQIAAEKALTTLAFSEKGS